MEISAQKPLKVNNITSYRYIYNDKILVKNISSESNLIIFHFGIFFVCISQMKTETKKQKNTSKAKSVTFYSHCCKSVGRVYIENWNRDTDGPFELEIIYHVDMVAMLDSIITIKESNTNDVIPYAFCAECGSLINPPIETEVFMKKIKNTLSQGKR